MLAIDLNKHDVVDALLATLVVGNGTALGLYNAVKSTLRESNIPLENIIGFASDNFSSMMGTKSGFQKLLKDDVPSVFIMGCVCHYFALCASHAVSVLPSYLEIFLKDLTYYFSRSSKRQRDFTLIQEVVTTTCHKIPKLAQTRWLSREAVITVILKQFDALLLYFKNESKVDKADGAKRICEILSNPGTKCMLLFFQYVLQNVNLLNVEFQSEHFRLHILYLMISSEYKNLLDFFIKDEFLKNTKLSEIDPSNETNYENINDIYLGGKATSHLISEPFDDEISDRRFKTDCLKFLVELCIQIRMRFSFSEDGIIAKLNVLDPKVAHDLSISPTSIIPLAVHFPSIEPESN